MQTAPFVLRLKNGKEKLPVRRHPWIFSNALIHSDGKPKNGSVVEIQTHKGDFIAWGCYSSHSEIRVRLLEWKHSNFPNIEWLKTRISGSIRRRLLLNLSNTTAYRLIFGESDGLPGIIADRFGDFAVIQLGTVYADQHRKIIAEILMEELSLKGVYEKSTDSSRTKEGLEEQSGVILGETPPESLSIQENGILYSLRLTDSQKTGFYCDQRDNRQKAAEFCKDKKVLDCFSYTGGFSLNALKSGASVTAVDSSAEALRELSSAVGLNKLDESKIQIVNANVFEWLRNLSETDLYDVIILDPPNLVSQKKGTPKALRAYKDVNLHAMHHLKPGGILISFSCSGRVSTQEFQQSIAWAAQDAGVSANVLQTLHQAGDHPIRLSYPESSYLKGFILEISK